jgi:hypothetical protein
MRSLALALAAAFCVALVLPAPAEAGWRGARGWGHQHTEQYHVYSRRGHVHRVHLRRRDRFAYRYRRRSYYPAYNSGYWRPAAELRHRRRCCGARPVLPRYQRAWGYPNDYYPNAYVVRDGVHWHHRR